MTAECNNLNMYASPGWKHFHAVTSHMTITSRAAAVISSVQLLAALPVKSAAAAVELV